MVDLPDAGKLVELAAKCEAATSADQKALILQAWESYNPEPFRGHMSELAEHREWREAYNRIFDLLKGGGLLDAAMTLVPEGWFVGLEQHSTSWSAEVANALWFDDTRIMKDGGAATPALALTAACLRAQASSEPATEGEG